MSNTQHVASFAGKVKGVFVGMRANPHTCHLAMRKWTRVKYLTSLLLDPSLKIVSRPFFLNEYWRQANYKNRS